MQSFGIRSLVLADETRILAIALAIFGAVLLSLGAQFQNDAIAKQQGGPVKRGGLGVKQLLKLLAIPKWLV